MTKRCGYSSFFFEKSLEIFFDLLYNKFAWTYDLVSYLVSAGMWDTWIKIAIPEISGSKILELGHGPGHLQLSINQSNYKTFGIDLSPQMGKITKHRISNVGQNALLVNGSGTKLPFKSDSFSDVIATFPTEYITEERTIREIFRVLMDGGKLTIIPIAWITGKSLHLNFLRWLFKITGQAPDMTNINRLYKNGPIKNLGYSFNSKIVPLKNSEVLIISTQKIQSN